MSHWPRAEMSCHSPFNNSEPMCSATIRSTTGAPGARTIAMKYNIEKCKSAGFGNGQGGLSNGTMPSHS